MNNKTRPRPSGLEHLSDVKHICHTCNTKAGGGDCESCYLILNLRQGVAQKDAKIQKLKAELHKRNLAGIMRRATACKSAGIRSRIIRDKDWNDPVGGPDPNP